MPAGGPGLWRCAGQSKGLKSDERILGDGDFVKSQLKTIQRSLDLENMDLMSLLIMLQSVGMLNYIAIDLDGLNV